jgi:hypothetical protein
MLLAGSLALYATLAVTSMRVKSAVFDEGAHLPAGYTYLVFGDHRLNPEHPPLVKLLAAAPLLLLDVELKPDDEAWRLGRQWEFGKRFLYRWNAADRLLFWGRLPIVALGAALAAAVFFWTRSRFGLAAAALALFLCVLSPDVLAHGQVVTTDLGLALFLFLSVAAFDRLAERATPLRLGLTGFACGAALATKFSGPIVFPLLIVLGLVTVFSSETMVSAFGRGPARSLIRRGERLRHLALLLALVAAIALAVLWASYGFRPELSRDAGPKAAYDAMIEGPPTLLRRAALAAERWRLLPEAYASGFLFAFKHAETRPTFVLGQLFGRGVWYYFPVTFLVKTPIPLLALVAAAPLVGRKGTSWRARAFVWLPILVYLALTFVRNITIGHRHLLPLYPFLFVAAGRCASLASGRVAKAAVAFLLAWYAAGTARIHPHYLAYFNEAAGGPANGFRLLVDSNLDWGQDLKGLKAWMDRTGTPALKLSYFGTADPAYYNIGGELLPGYMAPRPRAFTREVRPGELVAVSATNLQGVYLDPEDRPLMERFRARVPLARIGYSILIYRADFSWGP